MDCKKLLSVMMETLNITEGKSYKPIDAAKKLCDISVNLSDNEKNDIVNTLIDFMNGKNIYITVYLYSFLLDFTLDKKILSDFLQFLIDDKTLSANTLYSLFCQIERRVFINKCLDSSELTILKWNLFHKIVSYFKNLCKCDLSEIPYSKRNHNLSLMLTGQFLESTLHGPTRVALERAKTIKSILHKNVLLINTAEALSQEGSVPYINTFFPNYHASLLQAESQEWEGTSFSFIQLENTMPSIEVMELLLNNIRQLKPETVICIGGNSIFAALVNEIIPTLSISLCPSDLCIADTRYQTYHSEHLSKEQYYVLKQSGIPKDHIIKSIFPTAMRVQTTHYSKSSFGISPDKFVIVIVGWRLDIEMRDEFIDMMANIKNDNIVYLIIGAFTKYEEYCEKYPLLKERIILAGYADDLLAAYEACDLYINPIRKGGGSSGVEALFKGLPVITVDYGDVATNVGKNFCVNDYNEMRDMILKYVSDHEFYKQQRDKAFERAEYITNVDKLFAETMELYIEREQAKNNS